MDVSPSKTRNREGAEEGVRVLPVLPDVFSEWTGGIFLEPERHGPVERGDRRIAILMGDCAPFDQVEHIVAVRHQAREDLYRM